MSPIALALLVLMVVVLAGLPLWYATMRPSVRTPLLLGHLAVLQVIPGTLTAPYAFRLPGGLLLTPANLIVSAVFLGAVVLVLVQRSATVVRLAVLVVLAAGLVELGLLASTNLVLSSGVVEPLLDTDPVLYGSVLRSLLAGTPLVVVELLLFVVVTERLGAVITSSRGAALAHVGTFVAIVVLDGALFPLLVGMLEPGLAAEVAGGVLRKLVVAALLGLPLLVFVLRRGDDLDVAGGEESLRLTDVLLAPRHQLVARLERREQERIELLERANEVAEEERRRLAGDLHDDAIQLLTAADIRLQGLAATSPDVDLEPVRRLVQNGVGSLRRLILQLRGPDVTPRSFEPLVRSYIERLVPEDAWDVQVVVELADDVDEALLAAAYRVVLEAVSNAAKHARATRVAIRVVVVDDLLVGAVVDDGVGMPEEVDTGPGHLGLRAMQERVDMFEGGLDVRAHGDGTTVTFELPLDAAENGGRRGASPRA